MRYVVIYKDDQGAKHIHHVDVDSSQAAYDAVEAEYDAKHGKGAFDKLTVGVGVAADPSFRDQYEAKSGLKKPTETEDERLK
jgi:hypothetical protein